MQALANDCRTDSASMKPRASLAQRATSHGSEVPVVEGEQRAGAAKKRDGLRASICTLKAPRQVRLDAFLQIRTKNDAGSVCGFSYCMRVKASHR